MVAVPGRLISVLISQRLLAGLVLQCGFGMVVGRPGCSVDDSSYRRERNLRGSELANSGQMYKRSLVRISDTMTENFMSDGGNISLAENEKADHVCDGVPFRPFEIYVWQTAS